mgnify:FL=1|tara:strand:+ start:1423 stop:2670 length:1248 start_codon:yes stop_codon:yes gene_type:complete
MRKWIGQHIWEFISRFRSDVYLEAVESGTIASGGNLGLDSNNKIVKQADTGITDLHGAGVDGSANQILTDDGDGTVTSESTFTYNSGVASITSSTGPSFTLYNTATTETSNAIINFVRSDTSGADNHELGDISFTGFNEGGVSYSFANIHAEIKDATAGEEAGILEFKVAEFDGSLTTALTLDGDTNANGEIDVTIGAGAASVTTIAGTLTMGSTAAMTNAGLLSVANQSNITGLGTITSGTWQGTAIASAYLDSDTAHLSGAQTFTGAKQINIRKFSLTDGTAGSYQGDVVYFGGTTSMTAGKIYALRTAGNWVLADANTASTSPGLLAVALGAASDTNGMLIRGMVTLDHDPGDIGQPLFLSGTSGEATATAPSADGDIIRIIGYKTRNSDGYDDDTEGQIWFDPDKTWIEHA